MASTSGLAGAEFMQHRRALGFKPLGDRRLRDGDSDALYLNTKGAENLALRFEGDIQADDHPHGSILLHLGQQALIGLLFRQSHPGGRTPHTRPAPQRLPTNRAETQPEQGCDKDQGDENQLIGETTPNPVQ
jgi:hypothetical protein